MLVSLDQKMTACNRDLRVRWPKNLWITKEDILKNVGDQIVSGPIDFIVFFVHTIEVNGIQTCLDTNVLLCSTEKRKPFKFEPTWG